MNGRRRERTEALRSWCADSFNDHDRGLMRHPDDFGPEGSCFRTGFEPFFEYKRAGRTAVPPPPQVVAMCESCPVLDDCRVWAMARERYGFWGGMSEEARVAERSRLGVWVKKWAS